MGTSGLAALLRRHRIERTGKEALFSMADADAGKFWALVPGGVDVYFHKPTIGQPMPPGIFKNINSLENTLLSGYKSHSITWL